jgi:hypothetical protein
VFVCLSSDSLSLVAVVADSMAENLEKLTNRTKSPDTARAVSQYRTSLIFPKRVHHPPSARKVEDEAEELDTQMDEIDEFEQRIQMKEDEQFAMQLKDPDMKFDE